jgi:hypothetical protein
MRASPPEKRETAYMAVPKARNQPPTTLAAVTEAIKPTSRRSQSR